MSEGDGGRIPRPALALGLAGLIPFVAGAAGSWLQAVGQAATVLNVTMGYAAVTLSFLGGVHWGRALAPDLAARPGWARLLWAVTPALIGWAAMFVQDMLAVLALFLAAFTIAFFVDIKAVQAGMFPRWYGKLRKLLTIGVLAALLVALIAAIDIARM